jgi:hypothetical protein
MNRYTDITPSKFNPLSMEEIMMVPLMKRQQHNKLLADQQTMLAGLAKVDPHDKFYNEAKELKTGLESKFDKFAGTLATSGVDNNLTAEAISLNREYQDMVGPMGKIGQINAHNAGLQKEYADYVTNVTKMGYSPRKTKEHIDNFVAEHVNKEPKYDSNGRVINFKAPELPGNYKNHLVEAERYYKDMGMSSTEWSNAFAGVVRDGNGQYVASNSNGGASSSNLKNRQAVATFMNQRVNNPNDELRRAMDYEGVTPEEAIRDFKSMSGIYAKDSTMTKHGEDISNLSSDTEKPEGGYEGVATSTAEHGSDAGDFSDVDLVGEDQQVAKPSTSQIVAGLGPVTTQATYEKTGKKWTSDGIQSPIVKEQYNLVYDEMKAKGYTGGKDTKETAKLIKAELLKTGKVTLSTHTIKPDVDGNAMLFPGELVGKNNNQRTENIKTDVQSGARTIIDPRNGKKLTGTEAANEGLEIINYYGYDSPHNWGNAGTDYKFNNSKQAVSPHKVIVRYKDGDKNVDVVTTVSRTDTELNSNEFYAMEDLHKTYRKMTLRPGHAVPFQTEKKGVKGASVIYMNKNDKGQPLAKPVIEVSIPGNKPRRMYEEEYLEFMTNTLLKE